MAAMRLLCSMLLERQAMQGTHLLPGTAAPFGQKTGWRRPPELRRPPLGRHTSSHSSILHIGCGSAQSLDKVLPSPCVIHFTLLPTYMHNTLSLVYVIRNHVASGSSGCHSTIPWNLNIDRFCGSVTAPGPWMADQVQGRVGSRRLQRQLWGRCRFSETDRVYAPKCT